MDGIPMHWGIKSMAECKTAATPVSSNGATAVTRQAIEMGPFQHLNNDADMENALFIDVWTSEYSYIITVSWVEFTVNSNMFQASACRQVGDRPLSDPYMSPIANSHV